MHPLLSGQLYGLSAGAEPAWRGDHALGLEECGRFSTGAVELSVGSEAELPALLDYLASPDFRAELARFAHVSLHGPMKALSGSWETLAETFAALPDAIAGVVFHPDTLDESALNALTLLGPRLWLEDMDCRKAAGRDVRELAPLFARAPAAGFVLDVAHVWTLDPTLALGHELLDAYGGRLRELHVSGIEPDGKHRPTLGSDLERYASLLERCRQVPWILETPLVG